MHHHFLLLLSLLITRRCAAAGIPIPPPPATTDNATLEYVDPTLPPLLPGQTPKCTLAVLRHDFANTAGLPPVSVNYTPPPGCPSPWSRIVLELSASASDVQKDRIAAIWVNGAEILRTSTPYAMAPGVFWRVHKDVTRYTAILRGSADSDVTFSMMLENSNETFPGIYSVNVSLHFYRGALCQEKDESFCRHKLSGHPTIKGLYREPADLIVPISYELGDCGPGYWFKVMNESEVQVSTIQIPRNTYRAVLELYVSYHADDERWYANPLQSTGQYTSALSSPKANGGFRQAVVSIDKKYAGAVVPFPIIYPGSINPYFWAPVAAIGLYDFPSYDIDLTPFIGNLVDGREHEFGLTVRDSQPYWLVSANLHLWLDPWSDAVEAALVRYKVPPLRISKQADWRGKIGKSSVDGQVIERFAGWVSSSKGNITTAVRQRLKFKSRVEVQAKGNIKQV